MWESRFVVNVVPPIPDSMQYFECEYDIRMKIFPKIFKRYRPNLTTKSILGDCKTKKSRSRSNYCSVWPSIMTLIHDFQGLSWAKANEKILWFEKFGMRKIDGDITKLIDCEFSNSTGYFQRCIQCNVRLLRKIFETTQVGFQPKLSFNT